MLENFEILKKQLEELAPIINEYKSEDVQLKLIDIIFKSAVIEQKPISRVTKKSKKTSLGNKTENGEKAAVKKATSKRGPQFYLDMLITEGFFDEEKTINDIIVHLGTDKAKTYQANNLSTPLARSVRSGKLVRSKNPDGQYQYKKK